MFPNTQWTLILQAASTQTSEGMAALDQLCRRYWEPLRAYVRRQGYKDADADDVTQAFFARLLEHGTHARAERERGRFRTFLLNAMQNFISNERRDATRLKRGGGVDHASIDEVADDLSTTHTPETIFEKEWAQALIASALAALKAEYQSKGQGKRFELLRPLLSVRHDGDLGSLAVQMGVTTGYLRKVLHIFRYRFGDLVREEVARLVADPAEIDDELGYLMSVLSK